MAHPEADGCDVDESEVALRSFVVSCGDTAGVLELVETALHHVPQPVKPMIDTDAHLSGLAHRDLGQDIALTHGFPNAVSIIASIRQQHARLGQSVAHHEIKAEIVRSLPQRDVRSHGQAVRIDADVDQLNADAA